MSIGLFKLSHNQRKTLKIIFLVLNIFEILIGSMFVGVSIYVCVYISPMILTEKAEINFVFVVYALFGFNIVTNWLIGIRICCKCFSQAHKKSTRSLLLLWYFAGTNTVIMLIIIANLSKKTNRHIEKSMKNSIQSGMKNYLYDMDIKETIDTIQYNLECCGYDSYKDWHQIEWMDKTIINSGSKQVDELRYDKNKLYLPVIPWSCCKIQYPMQCFHDPIQQTAFTNLWVDAPETVADSINTKGCVEKMKGSIGCIIEGFIMLIVIVAVIHVNIFLVSRILYTSCRNAVLLYDPQGVAPGWIFGRGDCGYSRGKTLTELMGITNEILEQRILQGKRLGTSDKSSKSKVNRHSGEVDSSGFHRIKSIPDSSNRKNELESTTAGVTETEISNK
ncbi:photoreceptor outer segment membrane glycoprotein 2-like [Rhynchophorus ferrugineus]|uniref:Uncharacterized protein n=1 Tax=Rhynchophorus ferrugineus TaxID=354439 RepID=A0A834IT48_RHYFE|nr:hypothetical protein GWI33_009537 [Rhynchophorus ferrugineus]